MKYRSRTDITAQILEAANGGVTKTKIMYKAFLSYAQLKEYLTVKIPDGKSRLPGSKAQTQLRTAPLEKATIRFASN